MRRGAAALALFAVLSLLVQPICAAQENHAPARTAQAVTLAPEGPPCSSDPGSCCPEVEASVFVAPSYTGAAKASLAAQAAVPPAYMAAYRVALVPQPQQVFGTAPPLFQLAYYARSARIQR